MAGYLIALTIGLAWLGALCVWRVGDAKPRALNVIAVAFSVASGLASLALLPFASNTVALTIPIGGAFGDFTFVADGLGIFLACVATVIGSLAVIFSIDYMRGEKQLARYFAFVLIFIGAMAGLVLTNSLLLLFFFWEMVALCSYALISFHNDDPKAVAGGIKALVITQIGGIGLLVGVLVIHASLDSYEFSTFLANANKLSPVALSLVAFSFLIAAAAKSAQVPFHTWLPDAMEAPTPVSALIHAATMVNAGVYLLARFYPAFASVPNWATSVITMGVLSALLAGVLALTANDLKRALAYSTISQLGFMFYAIGVGAIFASQFHLLSHAVFKALLFLGAGAVIHAVGTRDMSAMGGLGKQMPFVRNVFVIGALALAGIPFANGFWSKELLLEAGWQGGIVWAYIGMLLGVGLTAAYSFRVVWLVFFGDARGGQQVQDAPTAMRVALSLLGLGTLTTWLLAGPFSEFLRLDPVIRTLEMIFDIFTSPATMLALIFVALGLAAWGLGKRRLDAWSETKVVKKVTTNEFGFEWLNQQIASATRRVATLMRATQTGQLNWNVLGIVGGMIIVMLFLVWSR